MNITPTKIVIADSNADVRAALQLTLEQMGGFTVLAGVQDAIELFSVITSECPQILLIDPELSGVKMPRRGIFSSLKELLSMLRRICPTLTIFCISNLTENQNECRLAGIDGYFYKGDPPDALIARLQTYNKVGDRYSHISPH